MRPKKMGHASTMWVYQHEEQSTILRAFISPWSFDQTRPNLLCRCPAYQERTLTRSEVNRISCSWNISLQKVAHFLHFFFIFPFCTLAKTAIECKHVIGFPSNLTHILKGYKAHLGTKFGLNTSEIDRIINDFSRKLKPICCCTYRANRLSQVAEIWQVDSLNIEPQTFLWFDGNQRKQLQSNSTKSNHRI